MTDKTRHKVATTSELSEEGDHVIVEIDNVEIAVYHVNGDYYAIANFCPHQGGPLCEGELTGHVTADESTNWDWEYDPVEKNVICPWHGWIFDITDGSCVDTERYRGITYDVELEEDDIFVLR